MQAFSSLVKSFARLGPRRLEVPPCCFERCLTRACWRRRPIEPDRAELHRLTRSGYEAECIRVADGAGSEDQSAQVEPIESKRADGRGALRCGLPPALFRSSLASGRLATGSLFRSGLASDGRAWAARWKISMTTIRPPQHGRGGRGSGGGADSTRSAPLRRFGSLL